MRVVVRLHAAAVPAFRRWRRTLSADRRKRRALADIYWRELVRRIEAAQGPPADAVREPGDVPVYWCELTGGTWVRLVVRANRRAGLLAPVTREVLAIQLRLHPPGPARP